MGQSATASRYTAILGLFLFIWASLGAINNYSTKTVDGVTDENQVVKRPNPPQ